MIQTPMDVLKQFPVRKSKKQKLAFRNALRPYVEGLGYSMTVEEGSMGSRNVVLGDPKTARYLITAHYDTCAAMFLPNLITPCNFLTFLLYQLFLTAVIMIPAVAASMLVSYLLPGSMLALWAFELLLIGSLLLMMFGPANRSNANDNTSGVVTLLQIAKNLPQSDRSKVCFVLFDLEEAGLIGSSSYRTAHKKESNEQMVLNLDCVGDGDEIMFFPTAKLKKDEKRMNLLRRCCSQLRTKRVSIREKGFSIYPSDQANFPLGVGICALKKGKLGLYMDRIHTKKDTILEETNVNILQAALISMIACDAQ